MRHYIQEELDARGWTVADVANQITTDPHEWSEWHLTVELLIAFSDEKIIVDESTADALGKAFGTSPQLFINLNDNYQRWRAAKMVSGGLEIREQ